MLETTDFKWTDEQQKSLVSLLNTLDPDTQLQERSSPTNPVYYTTGAQNIVLEKGCTMPDGETPARIRLTVSATYLPVKDSQSQSKSYKTIVKRADGLKTPDEAKMAANAILAKHGLTAEDLV